MCGTLEVITNVPPACPNRARPSRRGGWENHPYANRPTNQPPSAGMAGHRRLAPSVLQAAEGEAALPEPLQEQEGHDYGHDIDQRPSHDERVQVLRSASSARQVVPKI